MHSWFRSVAPTAPWAVLSAFLFLATGQASAQGELDFGGEEPPPEEGAAVPLEGDAAAAEAGGEEAPPPASAYVFAISADEELEQITNELDSALRDILAASPHFSSSSADGQLNGLDADAEEALRQAQELYDNGRDAAMNLEIDRAIDLFTQALATYEEQIAHVNDLNNISECLLQLGAAATLNGDTRQAHDFFERLLIIDPERRPDPDLYPPQVVETFEHQLERMERVRDGLINVTANPEGAYVFVDGIFQGPAPQELRHFKAGRHYIRVRRQGFVEAGQAVDVSSRRPTNLEFTLEETEIGPEVRALLNSLASQMAEGERDLHVAVQEIATPLGLEILATAFVSREDDGVMVRLNTWNIADGASIEQEVVGPFEADGLIIAGDVQPSFDELLVATHRALNVQSEDEEPVVVQPPEPPPPPPPPRAFWQTWWFWTIIGTVVVGTSVGLGVGLGTQPDPPGRTNGEVVFDL